MCRFEKAALGAWRDRVYSWRAASRESDLKDVWTAVGLVVCPNRHAISGSYQARGRWEYANGVPISPVALLPWMLHSGFGRPLSRSPSRLLVSLSKILMTTRCNFDSSVFRPSVPLCAPRFRGGTHLDISIKKMSRFADTKDYRRTAPPPLAVLACVLTLRTVRVIRLRNLAEDIMTKTTILAAVLMFLAADFASAQSVTYTTRANAGRVQMSSHQRHMTAQKTRLQRRFQYQRSHKSRLLSQRRSAMARSRGTVQGRAVGAHADRVLRERNKVRSLSGARRSTVGAAQQSRAIQQQRSLKRRQAKRRPNTPTPRTLSW